MYYGMSVLKAITEVSKPRLMFNTVVVAVASLYGASTLSPDAQPVVYGAYLHIIAAAALASAGAGALNHYYDRDIDPMMSRTSTRPIPSGRLSARAVLVYGVALSCISVICSYLLINATSAFFMALYIFSYAIIYTAWLKRRSVYNIVASGIAGSAASWAGWAAATGTLDLLGFLVGFLVFVWTPVNIWCMAMMIRDEYERATVRMLPFVIGMRRTSKCILANTVILVSYSLALYAFGMGMVYVVLAAALGGPMLLYHCRLAKNPTEDSAWKAWMVTIPYLTVIFLAVALDGTFHMRI